MLRLGALYCGKRFEKFARRRTSLISLLALAGLSLVLSGADARAEESWPTRQVTIVVPYPPGGYLDVVARVVADALHEKTHQNVIVLDKPGGNGQVGLGDLSRTTPDGYTLLVNNEGGICVQAVFDPNFHFDPSKDYTPLAQVVGSTYVLTVRNDLPVHSVSELIAYAKKAPQPLTFGSPGVGTTPHIGMEYFAREAGIQLLHVPYSGATGAINDLIGGRIDTYMTGISNIFEFAKSGRIRILAAMSAQRAAQLPDVPTMSEAGLPNFVVNGWLGLFGPPGMAPQLQAAISKAIADVVRDPVYAEKLRKINTEPVPMEAAEFAPFYYGELAKWKKFAAETNIKIGN
jgi:tripartite-type tricarboxylate transporter receptor subunit TctC